MQVQASRFLPVLISIKVDRDSSNNPQIEMVAKHLTVILYSTVEFPRYKYKLHLSENVGTRSAEIQNVVLLLLTVRAQ